MSKIREVLDCAIRDAEGNRKGGYVGKSGKVYPNYMHNEEWAEYKKMIPDEVKEKLKKETEGIPPKMACFGSSSRFVYNLLKSVSGIVFEKKLPTMVGGKANLDAYIKGICEIFIEAKCREIYSSHNSTEINECYEDVFKYLAHKLDWFGYRKVGGSTKTNYSKYSFYYNDRQIKRFDVKQLICHFLAISASVLEGTTNPNIKFIYLIFNPNSVVEHIDQKYKQKIPNQHEEALEEIGLFDMKALFDAILEYQKENLNKDYSGYPQFEFVIADQNTIEQHLK